MTISADLDPARAMPAPAKILGLAGLIPFAAGGLAVCFAPEIKAPAAAALTAYGAVILSFLGGIRWGFAVLEGARASWSAYGLSVTPSLIGWTGALIGGPEGLLILAFALAVWFFVERAAPPAIAVPAWYLKLRAMLTAIATLSLLAAAIFW